VQVDPALGSPWEESVVNGMIPVEPRPDGDGTRRIHPFAALRRPGLPGVPAGGPSNKAKVTLYEEGTL